MRRLTAQALLFPMPKGTHFHPARSTSTLRKCSPVSGFEAPRFTLTPSCPPPSPLSQDPLAAQFKRCSRQHKGPGRARNHGRRPARSKPGSSQRSDRQPCEPLPAAPDATLTCGRPTKAGEDTEGEDRWRLPPRKWLRELSLKSSQGPKSGSQARAVVALPTCVAPRRPSALRVPGAGERAEPPSGTGTGGGDPEVGGRGPARGSRLRQGRSQPRKVPGPRASSGGVQPGRV